MLCYLKKKRIVEQVRKQNFTFIYKYNLGHVGPYSVNKYFQWKRIHETGSLLKSKTFT